MKSNKKAKDSSTKQIKIPQDNSIFNPLEECLHKRLIRKIRAQRIFFPSDASCKVNGRIVGKCLRAQFFRWLGLPPTEKTTYRSWLSMRLGNQCEQSFLDLYKEMGLLKGTQIKFSCTVMGLTIGGRIDGMSKKGELIECKSAYGTSFFHSVNLAPKLDHLCQILLYMAILGIDSCIIPYICRDNAAKRAGYRMSKKQIEALGITVVGILARWKELKKYLNEKKIPPRDFEKKSWQCSYCGYKSKCEND